MKILYGIKDSNIDVTDICYSKLLNNNKITIPSGDFSRAALFTDPCFGHHKLIFINKNDNNDNDNDDNNDNNFVEYNSLVEIIINLLDNTVTMSNIDMEAYMIHSKLQIKHGSFRDELPEQKMAIRYLTGNEKVLEIGGNVGRNSLVIGHILREKQNNNFVTLESDPDIANQLIENRNLNKLTFHVEKSALSKRKLIQKGWDTMESDVVLDGYKNISIISLEELYSKYNIQFDTLVLDCEGAFYYILMDMPEILNNVNLIIMENDYYDISKKNYIDEILKTNNFNVVYVEAGGWGPCSNNFFEVWKK
jgi:FkbM family methyltransferase